MKISCNWIFVCIYTIGIFIATPYLPQLIRMASSRWSSLGVSRFVSIVEIAIALLILTLGAAFLIQKKKKLFLFLISLGGIFLISLILYQFIPNPYEFTHLPEYAVLSMFIMRALNKEKVRNIIAEKNIKSAITKNPYFMSVSVTGIIGTGDEIYQHFLPNRCFTLYDIFLNILGGILGLLVFWGIKREK